MSAFANLLADIRSLQQFPVEVGAVKKFILDSGLQDEVEFYPLETDDVKLRGVCTRTTYRRSPYGDPVRLMRIGYSATANICWQRFVCCKEMMHAFDSDQQYANSDERIATLIRNLTDPLLDGFDAPKNSPEFAEKAAEFRALCVLAPRHAVDQIRPLYVSGERKSLDIARFFRIPQVYIDTIFRPTFSSFYESHASEMQAV